MIGLKLTDGDFVFDGSDLVMVEDSEELSQEAYVALQTNQGEWFLDGAVGIQHSVVLQKQPDQEEIRAEIIQGLRQTGRIQTVDELSVVFDRSERKLGISFRATGSEGQTIQQQGVNIGA